MINDKDNLLNTLVLSNILNVNHIINLVGQLQYCYGYLLSYLF